MQTSETTSMLPSNFTFSGRLRSFTHAFRGLKLMLATQHNASIHAAVKMAVVIAGFAFRIQCGEWCWIVLAIVGVWVAETINTAFELVCDVASPSFHPIVKQAKDLAAGAVLLAAIGAAVVGALVFLPYIYALRN